MKKIYSLIALSLLLAPAMVHAQFSIGQTQYNQQANRQVNYMRVTNDNSIVQITAPGPNQTWDFSRLGTAGTPWTQYILQANQTPFASNFASANLAVSEDLNRFSYREIKTDGSFLKGIAQTGTSGVQLNVPNGLAQMLRFPLAYNDAVNNPAYSFVNMTTGATPIGQGVIRTHGSVRENYVVDAWGTLRLPGGVTHQVLRVQHTRITQDSLFYGAGFNGPWTFAQADAANTEVTYTFLDANGFEILRFLAPSQSGQAPFEVDFATTIVTALPSQLGLQATAKLYPNPAQDQVSVQVEGGTIASVEVLSLNGQKQSVSAQADFNGQWQVSLGSLASGTYLLRSRLESGRVLLSRVVKL